MSERKWTDAQKGVIDARDCNLLVAAAAGSGKTAVLVERIITKITDKENPIDIDELLVVTFTKAAAKEMKERIREAVDKKLLENPSDDHLIRQSTLISNADITTIDGFCMKLLRNYFNEIDLDPNFRVMDEGESRLLRNDVLEALMERHYEEPDEAFLMLTNLYAKKGRDSKVTEMIEKLYDFSISYAYPKEWLRDALTIYEVESIEDIKEFDWLKAYLNSIYLELKSVKLQMEIVLSNISECQDTLCYIDTVKKDMALIDRLCEAKGLEELVEAFNLNDFGRICAKPKNIVDEEMVGYAISSRDAYKKVVSDIKAEVLNCDTSDIYNQLKITEPIARELVLLTEEFMDDFLAAKREKNLVDFSDQEHMALDILLDKDKRETKIARELRKQYREVMIDEYQDSNDIQETLLSTVSGIADGINNYFMVGDVKQSIYRFRMSRPEIFTAKYDSFRENDADNRLIVLDKNFRSREEVLRVTNDCFSATMHKEIGNVEYDEKAKLYLGNEGYPLPDDASMFMPELLIAEADKEEQEDTELNSNAKLEAAMIGERILELKKTLKVSDGANLRNVKYKDIVILLRSIKGASESYGKILNDMGIPTLLVNSEGYFNTIEVETVLNFLRVIDNPSQDIPLVSVLHSEMFSFSDDMLTKIRTQYPKGSFFKAINQYAKEQSDGERLNDFLCYLDEIRGKKIDTPIHELIEIIINDTNYINFITALPGGARRRANVEKLIDQAITFENTSYKGLFRFINYIEKLQKYSIDLGPADLQSENDDAVRIMTIHKSKGLEFPVCFVAGLGKNLNSGKSAGMELHPSYGFAIPCMDANRRIEYQSFYKKALQRLNQIEGRGEELRVLYVAMTRAKEKLIMAGTMKKASEYVPSAKMNKGVISFHDILKANCFLKWVTPVLTQNEAINKIRVHRPLDFVIEATSDAEKFVMRTEALKDIEKNAVSYDVSLKDILSFEYKYKKRDTYKNKYSVSEIKHMEIDKFRNEQDMESWDRIERREKNVQPIIPAFISGEVKEENIGALRGTAMHRYMECFDFSNPEYENSIDLQLKQMEEKGLITPDQKALLKMDMLKEFFKSDLASRMNKAAMANNLYQEKAFVMGQTPKMLFLDEDEEQTILVQGIIDVFFRESDGIVLLDYKTDRVKSENELVSLYERQLQIYADAIEGSFNENVKELLLYSFHLGKVIAVSR